MTFEMIQTMSDVVKVTCASVLGLGFAIMITLLLMLGAIVMGSLVRRLVQTFATVDPESVRFGQFPAASRQSIQAHYRSHVEDRVQRMFDHLAESSPQVLDQVLDGQINVSSAYHAISSH